MFSAFFREDAPALAGYGVLAVLYTLPLARHFSTRYLTGSDTTYWLWDFWHFRYAAKVLHSNPYWTDLMYWPYGANLLVHDYPLYYLLSSFVLQEFMSLTSAFNLLLLLNLVLGGYGVFFITRRWGAGWGASFVAGAFYAFSSYTTVGLAVGNTHGYLSLQAMPLFLWALTRAVRSRRLLDAALVGAALTYVWGCSYYYFMFCTLLIPVAFLALERPLRLSWKRRGGSAGIVLLRRTLGAAALADLGFVALRLYAVGQAQFHGRGSFFDLMGHVLPYIVFWLLLGAWAAARWTLDARLDRGALRPRILFPYAAGIGCWLVFNLPLVWLVLNLILGGGYASPPTAWRGGGNPTDLLALLMPIRFHPLWGDWIKRLQEYAGIWPGQSGSLGMLPLAGVLWLWRRRPASDPWVRLWFAGALFSFLMTLGPWLKICGVHTYLPLPFYFVHLFPVYNNIQAGYLLNSFTVFFMSLLFAAFLKESAARLPARKAAWVPFLAFCWLAFELFPPKRQLYALEAAPIYERLGKRPYGAILPVPVFARFNNQGPDYFFGRELITQPHEQMVHHMPIVGGDLGRVARTTRDAMHDDVFFRALVAAQDGGPAAAMLKDTARVALYFKEKRLSYVLVKESSLPRDLREALKRWPMRLIDRDENLTLYSVSK